jgi:thiamine monophosphate synthase
VTLTSVSQIRAGTKGPFLVNYILREEPATLEIALAAGAPIVQFSWGMPTREMVSAIRTAGAKFGMQVTSAESARAALDLGADYLACQGTEAGGHVQANRGLYEALPEVLKEAREIPVLASGGIGNGEGIHKALVAGASGAMLGTRFVATLESNAHPAYHRALAAHGTTRSSPPAFKAVGQMPRTEHCGIAPSSCGMRPDVRQRVSGREKGIFWRGGQTEVQFSVTRPLPMVENFKEPWRNARCSQGWASMS